MKKQDGLTLIEVLIAVVVVAVALLGVASLQASVLSNTSLSNQYTHAAALAQGMAEKMRANQAPGLDDPTAVYSLAAGDLPEPTVNCNVETCTSTDLAQWDLANWYAAISSTYTSDKISDGPRGLLPSGQASVVCTMNCTASASDKLQKPLPIWIITIYWDADRTGRNGYGCNPNSTTDLRCFRLTYSPASL